MKIVLNIIKYISIAVFTCCMIVLILANVVSSTILNKQYIIGKLEETNYYEEIKTEIENSFENYIGQSGLDENVIKDIVSIDKIKEDTNTIISNIYDGNSISVDTTTIETNLKNNINNSLNGQKLTITQQKAIEEYINKIVEQYKDTMSHTNYESTIYNYINKANQSIGQIKKACIIGIAVSVILIFVCNYKTIVKSVSSIGISLASSGIFYIVVNIYIGMKIKVANIAILNEAISNTLKNIINDVLSNLLNSGIILFVIGLILVLLGNIIFYKNKAKEGKE